MAIETPPDLKATADSGKWAPSTLYEVGFQKWKQQQADIEALDRKAFGLFTVSSSILIAVLAVLKLHEPIPSPAAF